MTPSADSVSSASLRLPSRLLASRRHTAIVVGVLLALAVLGAILQARGPASGAAIAQPRSILPLYVSLVAAEWGLFYLAVAGLRARGAPWRDLIGSGWTRRYHPFRDLLIAITFWALWAGMATPLKSWLGAGAAPSLAALLPQSPAEILIWVLLSLSAGFCEEFVYRGYLQQQFELLTGSPAWALLLQAFLFGVTHGYQGWRQVIVISVYGFLFGLLARWRRSLLPGMVAHAWTDIAGGIVFPSA